MPKYSVEIIESSSREFSVTAPSPLHVHQMFLDDENLLGMPVTTNVYSSELTIYVDGKPVPGDQLGELLHFFSKKKDGALCGSNLGDAVVHEDDEVTCVVCQKALKKRASKRKGPEREIEVSLDEP